MTSANFTDWGEIPLKEIRHTLDDNWSTFHFGSRKFIVHRDDLDKIRERRIFAQALSAQAAMWETELAALEQALTTPTPDEPFGGPDPVMDKAVARVAELATIHRDPEEEGEL